MSIFNLFKKKPVERKFRIHYRKYPVPNTTAPMYAFAVAHDKVNDLINSINKESTWSILRPLGMFKSESFTIMYFDPDSDYITPKIIRKACEAISIPCVLPPLK